MSTAPDDFDTPDERPIETRLVLDLGAYEGPIDVLLTLAREQKVDLARISILALAEQYLAFIAAAKRLNLEIAADYLVMAAWLAYLKSRLLLPEEPKQEDEPSGEEMAAALAFQLQRLQAMQDAGRKLMALPRLGRDVFSRGRPEQFRSIVVPVLDLSLYQLLKAYGDHRARAEGGVLRIAPTELYSVEDALDRLRDLVGRAPDWADLMKYLPEELRDGLVGRSMVAATFAASLELAKTGGLEIRQPTPFGPIYVKRTGSAG
jgi:segregation and condensation protein A